jgi:Xaa-Pro aminopeptidase
MLTGIETPHSHLLLDGRTRKPRCFYRSATAGWSRNEGRVLSAEDVDLARQLTGAAFIGSTAAMQGDIQGECLGAPATIDTPLSPAEGSTDQRIELPARNSAILLDPWDGRVSREQHLAGLLRNRYPRTKVKNLTGIVDKLRSVKCTRLGPDRSHEEYAPRPVRIPPGRGSAL